MQTPNIMNRRRPIPRTALKPAHSLRYSTVLDGAVRIYPDGREVCQDSAKGWAEYKRRVEVMVERQRFKCCLCGKRISVVSATFEHQRRRGMGSAWRDDRILDREEKPVNGAAHWVCNGERG